MNVSQQSIFSKNINKFVRYGLMSEGYFDCWLNCYVSNYSFKFTTVEISLRFTIRKKGWLVLSLNFNKLIWRYQQVENKTFQTFQTNQIFWKTDKISYHRLQMQKVVLCINFQSTTHFWVLSKNKTHGPFFILLDCLYYFVYSGNFTNFLHTSQWDLVTINITVTVTTVLINISGKK